MELYCFECKEPLEEYVLDSHQLFDFHYSCTNEECNEPTNVFVDRRKE